MHALADVLLLGIDGGGSRCRARLCTISGATLSEGGGGPANIRLGVEQSFASVLRATFQCMSEAGLSFRDFERVVACLALAGASEPSHLEAARQHPYRMAGFVTGLTAPRRSR
jgi:glucosamine kinase